MILTFNYLGSTINGILIKRRKKTNDSITHETILYKNVCTIIIIIIIIIVIVIVIVIVIIIIIIII